MPLNSDFTLFESMKEHPDLIFNDATVQLFPIEENIVDYLGSDVIDIIHKTDPRICNDAIEDRQLSLFYFAMVPIVSVFNRN
ncbi:hypothetical protein BpHYR1_017210 [Brachionus plicatilis]|uniref:Uncharacterized protein n=1 Tax=Brachionus plicatilis TaxID=10195 RepID=A0A3M7QS05_BRAPC|nr:hypothetical protein BpHYR1_017210 [Brachionus plicatilis]